MPDQRDIFVSYSRANTDFARDLYAKLSALGFTLWRDRSDMEGGDDWFEQIKAAIRAVQSMVLVMSPAALQSAIVAEEWRYALQVGTRVIPVIAEDVDFNSVPRWMSKRDWYDFRAGAPEHSLIWDKFIAQLKAPYTPRRVPFTAPKLTEHYVNRPAIFDKAKALLLSEPNADRDNPVALTTAFRGGGGFGKTTLAVALCHDPDVRQRFDDGVLFVTFGETPDVLGLLGDQIKLISDESATFTDVNSAAARFRELVDGKDMLIVLDDVWDEAHAKPFLEGKRAVRLITSRNVAVTNALGAKGDSALEVNQMAFEEAAALLVARLSPEQRPSDLAPFTAFAVQLGGWALLVELASGHIADFVENDGMSALEALHEEQARLQEYGFEIFDPQDETARNKAAGASLAVSLKRLGKWQDRFIELAIFPEDTDVRLAAIAKLWQASAGLREMDAKDALRAMHRLSLFARYELSELRRFARLHDVIRKYLRGKLGERLSTLHTKFLSAYGVENWADLTPEEPYLWDHLAYHLLEAGKRDDLRAALLDYRYLQAKLNARNANALLSDCDAYLSGGADEPIRLLRSALSMSGHILAEDKRALAYQLTGRLMTHRAMTEIRQVLVAVQPPSNTLIQASWDSDYATHEQAGGAIIRTLRGHTASVTAVAYAPDGARLVSASRDNTLIVWDAATGEALRTLRGHRTHVNAVAYAPDGARLVSASWQELIVWDAATGEALRTLRGHTSAVTAVAYAPDGARLVSASEDKTLIVWDAATGEALRTLRGHTERVTAVAYAPDGARLVSASEDKTLIVWDAATGEALRTLRGHTASVNAVAYAPDGARLVSASSDNTLIVWDAATGEALRALRGHTASVNAVAYAPDGARLVSASEDKTLIVWDAATGEALRTLRGHTSDVNAVAYAPDGARLVSASYDTTLIVWDAATGEALRALRGHEAEVTAVAYAPDGARLVSASEDNTLIVWDAATGEALRTLRGHTARVNAVAYAPDGARLVSASSDKTLIVWDAATGEALRALRGHTASVNAVAYAPDGARLVSASGDKTLIVWDAATGEALRTLRGHTALVDAVAYAPDGARLVSASFDNPLIVRDAATGEALRALRGHTAWVTAVAYAPDGARLVSASRDNTLIVWDAATGEALRTLRGHTWAVTAVAYAPDGARLVSASLDKTLIVWDAATGQAIHTFYGDARFNAVAWSSDGQHIAAGDSVGRVLLLRWVE